MKPKLQLCYLAKLFTKLGTAKNQTYPSFTLLVIPRTMVGRFRCGRRPEVGEAQSDEPKGGGRGSAVGYWLY